MRLPDEIPNAIWLEINLYADIVYIVYMAIAWRHENKVKLSAHLSSAICWQHFTCDDDSF